jgi:hypothetical protein
MSKRNNTKTTETLSERIARIEAKRAEFTARCDKLIEANKADDMRRTALMGW